MRRIALVLAVLATVVPALPASAQLAQKQCVDGRQTEDPSSPACIPYYDPEGDNGGATWQGVTKDEIKVLAYLDGNASYSYESVGSGRILDLDNVQPDCPSTYPVGNPGADSCDAAPVRAIRALGHFFNDRFQTYNRRAHLYAYFSSANSAAERRADAAMLDGVLGPFAVFNFTTFYGYRTEFDSAMAARGAMVFPAPGPVAASDYAAASPNAWNFWPDAEHRAATYAGYVCSKLKDTTVQHSGLEGGLLGMNGEPRKFGIWRSRDPSQPEYSWGAAVTRNLLAQCELPAFIEATYAKSGYAVDNSDLGADARDAATKFAYEEVNTVLHLGGVESKFSHSADLLRYYPEIIVSGDMEIENPTYAQYQNRNVWRNAYGPTPVIRRNTAQDGYGYRAYRQASPGGQSKDLTYAEEYYRQFFTAYMAVQAAGPILNPTHVLEGFRAIPTYSSSSPYQASVSFPEGDFSGVDDAMEVWWDPNAQLAGSTLPGCYRMSRDGQRFRPADWSGGFTAFGPNDRCLANASSVAIRPL